MPPIMARSTPPLVPLGYGKFVRADRVYALLPLEGPQRGDGRRTLVHVEGIDDAIAEDLAEALGQESPRGRRGPIGIPGQEHLF
jgi:hypothetical protein